MTPTELTPTASIDVHAVESVNLAEPRYHPGDLATKTGPFWTRRLTIRSKTGGVLVLNLFGDSADRLTVRMPEQKPAHAA